MRLRLLTGHYRGSMEGLAFLWLAGEVHEVPEASGAYLLATFPGRFEPVEAPAPVAPIAADVSAPPVDRAVKSPPKRR